MILFDKKQGYILSLCRMKKHVGKTKAIKLFSVKFFFKMFLLAYNSCTGGFVVTFPYMHTTTPAWFIPSTLPPSLPSSQRAQNSFNRFQCSIFLHV
jgi:hypothetical protein